MRFIQKTILVLFILISSGLEAGKRKTNFKRPCPYLSRVLSLSVDDLVNASEVLGISSSSNEVMTAKAMIHRALRFAYSLKTHPDTFENLGEYRSTVMRHLLTQTKEFLKSIGVKGFDGKLWTFYVLRDSATGNIAFSDADGKRSIVITPEGDILMGSLPGGGYTDSEYFDKRYLRPYQPDFDTSRGRIKP